MLKPVLLMVDEDADVRRTVVRLLKLRYSAQYRIVGCESEEVALTKLASWKEKSEAVALVLSDSSTGPDGGIMFMRRVTAVFPGAKRLIFTNDADYQDVLTAFNGDMIDSYLTKSSDPPEDRFYPLVDDLLQTWQSGYCSPFQGITVIGHRWSATSHAVKDYLARNQHPFRWLDVESAANVSEVRSLMASTGEDSEKLPMIIFADGSYLAQPTLPDIAEKLGLHTHAEKPFYDLVIIGAGPAGMAAAVYGASEGLRTLLIEREAPGGQAGTTSRIENYLGFPKGLSGADLAHRGVDQVARFGVEVLAPQEAINIQLSDPYRIVKLADGSEVTCYAVLLAMGVQWRILNAPGVERLTGCGVYYGASMTEAVSCTEQDAYIVGGANSAGQAAIYFAKFANRVTMLVRGDSLAASMSQYLIDEIDKTPNISVRTHSEVVAVEGDTRLETVTISNNITKETEVVPAAALFLCIGAEPHTEWLGDLIERDDHGFVISGPDLLNEHSPRHSWPLEREPYYLETSAPGVFVAGDVWNGPAKRVAAAVGQGAVSVQFVHRYLATVR